MKLTWYGHAAFGLVGRTSDGRTLRVVTDPYTPASSGYAPIRDRANVVVTSSVTDDYHDRADLVPGDHTHVDALAVADTGGARTVRGLDIRAVPAAEAELHPSGHPDRCALYSFTLDGLRVSHLGDVGNPLDEWQIEFLRGTDVLLALAGGFPTIALADLATVIEAVKPPLVVPMHFRTLTYRPRNTLWIESFLAHFDDADVDFACAHTVEIERESLPSRTRALVLDYVR